MTYTTVTIVDKNLAELIFWCADYIENGGLFSGRTYRWEYVDSETVDGQLGFKFRFGNIEDAILFKMTWC